MPMQSFGYAFIYGKTTKEPIYMAGEISGLLREGFNITDRYPEYDPETMSVTEFAYGENREEIEKMGSWYVDGEDIVIIPRFTVSIDKTEIDADGEDTAVITVNAPQDTLVTFTIDGNDYEVSTDNNGNATINFATEIVGDHHIAIICDKHGRGGVIIHAS